MYFDNAGCDGLFSINTEDQIVTKFIKYSVKILFKIGLWISVVLR